MVVNVRYASEDDCIAARERICDNRNDIVVVVVVVDLVGVLDEASHACVDVFKGLENKT